ncbi:hypothetical protein GCM10027589_05600 [Actinocorallia lasiicapitis]
MTGQLVLLVTGFVLTSVLGGVLGSFFQRRTWSHQHKVQRQEQERQLAIKIFEEVSSLLDRRLYRMRLVFWAAKRRARQPPAGDLDSALDGYREALATWNDNLNRLLALTEAYFGEPVRREMENVYQEFTSTGRALDEFVRDVSTHPGETDVPPIRRRLRIISNRVYRLNLHMLQLIRSGRLGPDAPSEPPPTSPRMPQLGDEGPDVRRLQQSLRTTGHLTGPADGVFGRATHRALTDFQRSRNLTPDAIAGPTTLTALPDPAPRVA